MYSEAISPPELWQLGDFLRAFFKRSREGPFAHVLSITAENICPRMQAADAVRASQFGPPPFFQFGNIYSSGMTWEIILDTFIRPIRLIDVSTVTTFELSLTDPPDIMNNNTHLINLLYSLNSTETLYVHPTAIETIISMEQHTEQLMFPRLHNVVIWNAPSVPTSVIMRFILRRQKADMPIRFLDLTHCRAQNVEELVILEGQRDLEVLWTPEMQEIIDNL